MVNYSSILAWRIPWTEQPDGRGEVPGCVRSMFGRGAKGEANWCAGDGAGVGEGVGNDVGLRDSG